MLGLAAFAVAHGQTQVPNTFQSGQPARASEVNANFSVIETAVNDNDTRITNNETGIANNSAAISNNAAAIVAGDATIQSQLGPVVMDGNDSEIGRLISIGENHWSVEIITQQGFLITLSVGTGAIGTGTLFFASMDCSGAGYVANSIGGYVENMYDSTGVPNLQYVDKNSVPISNFISASLTFSGGCFTQPDAGLTVFPVLPNDPAITGITNSTFQLPIKIQLPQ